MADCTHTVKTGDSLNSISKIAKYYGVSSDAILNANPDIKNPKSRKRKVGWIYPGDKVKIPSTAFPARPPDSTVVRCAHPSTVKIRIVSDGGTPATPAAAPKSKLNISPFVTNQQLPNSYATASTDPDNFKIEVEDACAGGNTIPQAKVEIEVLKPCGSSFRPKRTLKVELEKITGTDLFRSKYLRLVTDDKDQAAAPDQTLRTDWDKDDHSVEILGQKIRAIYKRDATTKVSAESIVGNDPKRIKMAVHIVKNVAGSAGRGVVTKEQADIRVNKWVRRFYAQVNMAPKLVATTRYIDPPANLISISNEDGKDAMGGAPVGMKFDIRVIKAGSADKVYNIGPYKPPVGATAMATAQALANLVGALPGRPLRAATFQNPKTKTAGVTKGSADIVVTDPGGGRIIIENESSDDGDQKLFVDEVEVTNFNEFSDNSIPGTLMERTLFHACDTGSNRIDIAVVNTLDQTSRGEAFTESVPPHPSGRVLDYLNHSAVVYADSMNGTDVDPNNLAHEMGHVLLRGGGHASVNTELMRSGTDMNHDVGTSKRISKTNINFHGTAINQYDRMRSQVPLLIDSW